MRLKIIAGNLVVVLIIGLVSFFVVRSQLQAELAAQVDARIADEGRLLGRSFRLSGLEFLERVVDRSQTQQVRDTFLGLDDTARRTRAHQAANQVAQWFQDPARGRRGAPDIVAITDETGRVVARNQDPNRMHGEQLGQQLPALRGLLQDGVARHDAWEKADENKVLQTAIAPIRSEAGAVIGALVVAYDLSNGYARSEGELLGRDVAFVVQDNVYSSSLSGGVNDSLKNHLFDALSTQTARALEGDAPSSPWQVALDGSARTGVVAPLPMAPSVSVAYVVLANKSAHMEPAGIANIVLILTVLGAILVLAYGFIVGTSFLKPVEEIEEGVLAVINGRTDLRLDVESAEFGGLAYRINQLINVFTGVEEEDEDGRVSSPPPTAPWRQQEDAPTGGGAAAPSGGSPGPVEPIDDPAIAGPLGAEAEEAYLGRVYNEYVAAKTAAGENVAIKQEVFAKRMVGQGSALAKQHGCRMVRFQVETRGSRVELRPVLIR